MKPLIPLIPAILSIVLFLGAVAYYIVVRIRKRRRGAARKAAFLASLDTAAENIERGPNSLAAHVAGIVRDQEARKAKR